MALTVDCLLLLAQAILYFLSVVCGLAMSIPLGVTTGKFKGNCLLYATVDWTTKTVEYANAHTCNFPVYLAVSTGIMYATFKGVYSVYCLAMKDRDFRSRMWVFLSTIVSGLAAISFFVAACTISVGLKVFCDSYLEGSSNTRCVDAEKSTYYKKDDHSETYDGKTFYEYLTVSEISTWVMFLIWAVQVGLGIARMVRNRRLRSQPATDMTNIAAVEPTA